MYGGLREGRNSLGCDTVMGEEAGFRDNLVPWVRVGGVTGWGEQKAHAGSLEEERTSCRNEGNPLLSTPLTPLCCWMRWEGDSCN